MKSILKDYGPIIGPACAFVLGVIAIYIKFYSDRQLDKWKSKKKLAKLFVLIRASEPPKVFHPAGDRAIFTHADDLRNLTSISTFAKKIKILTSFLDTVESDILTNCSPLQIQQFTYIKFQIAYLSNDVEAFRNLFPAKGRGDSYTDAFNDKRVRFERIGKDFEQIIVICNDPRGIFGYSGEYRKL